MSEADELEPNEDAFSEEAGDGEGSAPQAKDELAEALGHFKSAASIMIERAKSDPRFKDVGREAERVFSKFGSAAEPVARQFGDEISRFTQKMANATNDPSLRQVGDELSRFTKKMASAVESTIDAVEGVVDRDDIDDEER